MHLFSYPAGRHRLAQASVSIVTFAFTDDPSSFSLTGFHPFLFIVRNGVGRTPPGLWKGLSPPLCFKDTYLRELIEEEGKTGTCPWCGTEEVKVIPLRELSEPFREVAQLYEPVEFPGGDDISYLIQQDWEVFSDHLAEVDTDTMQELCEKILVADLRPKEIYGGTDYEGGFRDRDSDTLLRYWYQIASEAASGNISPETEKLFQYIGLVLEDLSETLIEGMTVYRARIHDKRERKSRYELHEIGAPPPDCTKAGRANREGKPVLYLATDGDTALAEVRAWRGAAVAIGTFAIRERLHVADLTKRVPLGSPFAVEDLRWRVDAAMLLYTLAEDLSRPLIPKESERHYKPTQLLCEKIQSWGYDGVFYDSAMDRGKNLVIFDQAKADPQCSNYVRVGGVQFDHTELLEDEEPYPDIPYEEYFNDFDPLIHDL